MGNEYARDPNPCRARFLTRPFHAVKENLCLAFCCFGQR